MEEYTLSDFSSDGSTHCPLCSNGPDSGEYDYKDLDYLRHLANDHGLMQKDVLEHVTCSSRTTLRKYLNKAGVDYQYQYEISEDELRELYLEEGKSIDEIADHYGCSYFALRNRLQNYGIEIRSIQEASLKNRDEVDGRYTDEEFLTEQYIGEAKSAMQIADMCNVSRSTVEDWMHEHGIETRSFSEAQINRREKQPWRDEEELQRLYWEEGMSTREIGEYFGVTMGAIVVAMNKYGMDFRYAGAHGLTYETERGEHVRSSHERQIADWFYRNGVDYTYEPELEASMVPDFLAQGTFIEYWGMINREDYRERMREKQAKYEEMGIKQIDLFPSDLDHLDERLGHFTTIVA